MGEFQISCSMDWVHCNNCFILPGSEKRFFLTSCGHIFCADCISRCTDGLCKLCGNQCTSIPLSSQMKPEIEMYFIEPIELLKKEIAKVQQIVEFQNNHRSRLMAYNNKQTEKMKLMKEDMKKMVKRYKELESDKKRYKEEINYLKNLIGFSPHNASPDVLEALASRSNCSSVRQGSYKGHTSPADYISPTNSTHNLRERMFPKPHSVSSSAGRVSVRTPPINGRMGVIPGIPTELENMHSAARNSVSNVLSPLYTSQSQESINSDYYLAGEDTPTPSPTLPGHISRNYQQSKSSSYRYNDKKKNVVYPLTRDK